MDIKKIMKWFVTWSIIVALLGACGTSDNTEGATPKNDTQNNQTTTEDETAEQEDMVLITISKNAGEETLDEKTVPIEEGALLIEVMEEHFDLETDFDGAFIVSIDGVGPEEDEEIAWMYTVNDEVAMVGANEYELEPGDEVVFDLQPW